MERRFDRTKYFGAPGPSDLHMLQNIIGDIHVGQSNDFVANKILTRIALNDKHKKPINGLRTLDAWRDAAIDIHIRNRVLYTYVMTGRRERNKRKAA